ncbi:fungal-specific transcription factor domain-containing protein [Mycena rebaudengoi]|nr:fungal-specific transcription factor domain-containing protein [Mycena rebaudengoi]
MPGNRCTNCINSGLDCTHAEALKNLGSAKGYVESLENRLEKMEKLLNKLLPGVDVTEQLDEDDIEPDLEPSQTSLPRNDGDCLVGTLTKLTLNPDDHRFFGKSSGIQFVQTALNFKMQYTGAAGMAHFPHKPNGKEFSFLSPLKFLLPEAGEIETPQYTFPPPDLIVSLVHHYFSEINCYFPLLHKPTFESKLADDFHFKDNGFACTLLMVCSLGSRFSEDPRVLLDGSDDRYSAGWKWHKQVRVIPEHLIFKPTVYELQTIALSSMFLTGMSPASWNLVGFGLRRAVDVGAHRRRTQPRPTSDNEHWKRAFWVLLVFDGLIGTTMGRPVTLNHHDFDQDLPLEVDDIYWDHPEPQSFRQPDGEPSEMAFFNCHAKLIQIQSSITITIYSPRRPRDLYNLSEPPTDAQAVSAFDSALNSWLSEVPEHLLWDPQRKNELHLRQSALLFGWYHHVQIMLHRPYIPGPQTPTHPNALPSLTICTNAARSVAHIVDALGQRNVEPHHNLLWSTFTSALVLLLNTWSRKRSPAYNPSKDLADAYKCFQLFDRLERRYVAASRFRDVLSRLISVGDIRNEFECEKNDGQCDKMFVPPQQVPLRENADTLAQHLRDFSQVVEVKDACLARPPNSFRAQYSADAGPVHDFEQLQMLMESMESQQFPGMLIDSDMMSMWSASIPQMDHWNSYLAANSDIPPAQPLFQQQQHHEMNSWLYGGNPA